MITRISGPSSKNSFFLFGARGTGKSTLVRERFIKSTPRSCLALDLLDPVLEDQLLKNPHDLVAFIDQAMSSAQNHESRLETVFIDEVQKAPRLLDLVHKLIEERSLQFILTGSSARKLKRGGANLLAGRAFVYQLFPFSHRELKESFDLQQALHWGTLPQCTLYNEEKDKMAFLQAYALTYVKEEIQNEQLLRKLVPFRKFLELAAQMNGRILNYSKIGNDVETDHNTVKSYFSILEDTWMGFLLPTYRSSFRKSLKTHPKFYFFDPGVTRALSGLLTVELNPKTSAYGMAFEHWVILEFYRLNHYYMLDYRLYYLGTKDNVEVDLILERGGDLIAIEIKSSTKIDPIRVRTLSRISKDLKASQTYFLSQDPLPRKIEGVHCREWKVGITEILGLDPC